MDSEAMVKLDNGSGALAPAPKIFAKAAPVTGGDEGSEPLNAQSPFAARLAVAFRAK